MKLLLFVLFLAVMWAVKLAINAAVDAAGPWPFVPVVLGIIAYGAWYEWRHVNSADWTDQ